MFGLVVVRTVVRSRGILQSDEAPKLARGAAPTLVGWEFADIVEEAWSTRAVANAGISLEANGHTTPLGQWAD